MFTNVPTDVTGTVTYLERMKNSRNGNPRWLITINTGAETRSFLTKPNAMCAYKVYTGLVGKSIEARVLQYYGRPQIYAFNVN